MSPNLHALPIHAYLEKLHANLAGCFEGAVASYIPELTRADPAWFGIALVTVDGHVYQVGDSHQEFTIQSVSKAITYGLALEDRGVEAVLAKVGVEPSGEAFNSISLERDTGRPFNPMINAGAIATTGLIEGADWTAKMARILKRFEHFVGHPVTVDDEVYRSERDTGHRNRAIAHLLRNANIIEDFPEEVVDLYFRQCSIRVTARDLALMGACLANNGVNPITSVVAQKSQYVDKVLGVMTTCGMYDYTGTWVYSVGLPAKSGVGGGIMAVLPGQFGLGVFSPLLDPKGNSVRGLRVCEALSRDFGLHMLKVVRATSASVVRVRYDGATIRSRRQRLPADQDILARHGARIRVYELQGELRFASTDSLLRGMAERWDATDFLILDFHRVVEIDAASTHLLCDFLPRCVAAGKTVLLTGTEDKYSFRRAVQRVGSQRGLAFGETDRALEWCESQLVERFSAGPGVAPTVSWGDQYLCHDMTDSEITCLERCARRREFKGGSYLFRAGEIATSLFFVVQGEVDLVVRTQSGAERRVVTVCAGRSFGEFALATGHGRATDARAVGEVVCMELAFADIDGPLRARIMANLARELASQLSLEARQLQILG